MVCWRVLHRPIPLYFNSFQPYLQCSPDAGVPFKTFRCIRLLDMFICLDNRSHLPGLSKMLIGGKTSHPISTRSLPFTKPDKKSWKTWSKGHRSYVETSKIRTIRKRVGHSGNALPKRDSWTDQCALKAYAHCLELKWTTRMTSGGRGQCQSNILVNKKKKWWDYLLSFENGATAQLIPKWSFGDIEKS